MSNETTKNDSDKFIQSIQTMKFGERLKFLRQFAGLSGKEMSEKVGVSYAAYMGYENKGNQPKLDTLSRISQVLNVSTDFLLGRSNIPEKEFANLSSPPKRTPTQLLQYAIDIDDENEDFYDDASESEGIGGYVAGSGHKNAIQENPYDLEPHILAIKNILLSDNAMIKDVVLNIDARKNLYTRFNTWAELVYEYFFDHPLLTPNSRRNKDKE